VEADRGADALVVITCDEERGGLGSERLSLPDGPWRAEGGVVLEPTNFAICTAQTGNVDVRVEVTGPSSHAYAPEPAPSPITAVLAVIEELDTCRFLKARHPKLPDPRLNVGRIDGGEHPWRIPAHAALEATLGVVPGTDVAEAEAEVRSRLDDVARRWDARGLTLRFDVVDRSEPIDVAIDRVPIASRIAGALGVQFEPAGMPSWTDAGNLLTKYDLPCVVFGAGELRNAHSDHESVAVGDLVRLAEVLRTVLTSA
jgi:acetylornithine deacetylase/succinyl-diaminopimelate desuccinylase-like protein